MPTFLTPLRIFKRPDQLTIIDYRPTFYMFLSMVGFLLFIVLFLLFLVGLYEADSFGLGFLLAASMICLVVSMRGTLREVYYFNKTTDSYAFIRQFIYRKETLEGSASQFRGVRVHEIEEGTGRDHSTRYVVNLLQDGMLFGTSPELTLRDTKPILNFHAYEMRIASAISSFLEIKLLDTHD